MEGAWNTSVPASTYSLHSELQLLCKVADICTYTAHTCISREVGHTVLHVLSHKDHGRPVELSTVMAAFSTSAG